MLGKKTVHSLTIGAWIKFCNKQSFEVSKWSIGRHRHLIKIPVCLVCQEESLEKPKKGPVVFPIGSMYGVFTYISL